MSILLEKYLNVVPRYKRMEPLLKLIHKAEAGLDRSVLMEIIVYLNNLVVLLNEEGKNIQKLAEKAEDATTERHQYGDIENVGVSEMAKGDLEQLSNIHDIIEKVKSSAQKLHGESVQIRDGVKELEIKYIDSLKGLYELLNENKDIMKKTFLQFVEEMNQLLDYLSLYKEIKKEFRDDIHKLEKELR